MALEQLSSRCVGSLDAPYAWNDLVVTLDLRSHRREAQTICHRAFPKPRSTPTAGLVGGLVDRPGGAAAPDDLGSAQSPRPGMRIRRSNRWSPRPLLSPLGFRCSCSTVPCTSSSLSPRILDSLQTLSPSGKWDRPVHPARGPPRAPKHTFVAF